MKEDLAGCAAVLLVGAVILWVLAVEIAKGVAWLRWAFG